MTPLKILSLVGILLCWSLAWATPSAKAGEKKSSKKNARAAQANVEDGSDDLDIVIKKAGGKKKPPRATASASGMPALASATKTALEKNDSFQFANVPRAYVTTATAEDCQARFKELVGRLTGAKALILKKNDCRQIEAPAVGGQPAKLVYQGIIDFVR